MVSEVEQLLAEGLEAELMIGAVYRWLFLEASLALRISAYFSVE